MSPKSPFPDIYLDASVLVDGMFRGLANYEASSRFITRLITDGSRVYFSQLVRLEIGEAVRRLATRQQLPVVFRQRYDLGAWATNPSVRERWMAFGLRQFDRLIAKFADVLELPFEETIWRRSIDYIAQYGVRAHDAVQIATALDAGLQVFATNDDDFRRVGALHVMIVRNL